jgi:hypothetical protein
VIDEGKRRNEKETRTERKKKERKGKREQESFSVVNLTSDEVVVAAPLVCKAGQGASKFSEVPW